MFNKLLSIVIPVYNCKETLPTCLNSILSQNFGGFEIILIDNGSTDASKALCDGYEAKDPRVTAIHMKHGEVADALNAGIKAASGRYLLFMDATDYIEDINFERFADQLWQDFDVIFIKTSELMPDGTKEPILGFDALAGQSHDEVLQKLVDVLPDRLWDKLIRKRILSESNIKFDNVWENVDFCMSLYLHATSYGVLADLPYYCHTHQAHTRNIKEWCQKIILTLSKWTSAADLHHEKHDTIIHHWMAAMYCEELIPLCGKLSRAEMQMIKHSIDDFAWLMDIREKRSDKIAKNLYHAVGVRFTGKLIAIFNKIKTRKKNYGILFL